MTSFVDIKAIAALLGCCTKTVRRKVRKGLIPVIQPDGPGTLMRFDLDDVLRSLKSMPVEHTNADASESKNKKEKLSGPQPKWMNKTTKR